MSLLLKNNTSNCHLDPNILTANLVKNNNAIICDKHIKRMVNKINRNGTQVKLL